MTRIKTSTVFKKDFKPIKANPRHSKTIDELLINTINQLMSDQPLPPSFRDHKLIGNWQGARECHLKPDLLLIYRIISN
ncbi:MAG: type II toxin-antitoxin system YafQ family toxin, partial [Alphaproteobacteria bacterium]|nr:type II toxin-antitoxin system YafQ family toxin [Alphaproteobacteria bacterium]